MSQTLGITFDLLAHTSNEAAVDVLLLGLESHDAGIQSRAFRALLERRNARGQVEIVRRLDSLTAESRRILEEKPGALTQAVRESLSGNEIQLRENAFQAVLWLREYDVAPALIELVETPRSPVASQARAVLLELAKTLYKEISGPRDYSVRRDPQIVRRNVVSCLEASLARFDQHRRPEVAQAFLTLCNRDNATLKNILLGSHGAAFRTVVDILRSSRQPGVMHLLASYIDDPHPPLAVITTLTQRYDAAFVQRLLKRVGPEVSPAAQQNLRGVHVLRWADPAANVLATLGPTAQRAAIKLLAASGIPREVVYGAIEFLMRNGAPAGRLAATEALAEFHGPAADSLAMQALDDLEPTVQAAAVAQMRQRAIPAAVVKLIALADSPHETVRQAVRESLTEFRFTRYLSVFESLDDAVRHSTGQLVMKIDPDTLPLLREELASASRGRRIRGIQVCRFLDATPAVEGLLLELLGADDHLIRMEAARTLASSAAPRVKQALEAVMNDDSELVREAARQSLQEIDCRKRQAKVVAPSLRDTARLATTSCSEGDRP